MVASFFHPTGHAQAQMRPASPAQMRLQGRHGPVPFPPQAGKPQISVKTTAIPTPASKSLGPRRPSVTRTQSSPSTTTAPMFPDEILPNLYISDLETARAVLSPNYSSPGRPKVKYVLTLLDNAKDQPRAIVPTATATDDNDGKSEFVLKLIKLSDYCDVNILEKLPEACTFIRECLSKGDGGVLVHCRKGVSRSGSVMVAYLMQELCLGFDEALQRAKSARSRILPNRAFGEQLRMWKDLNYSLVDETGQEKIFYSEWRSQHRFRPEKFEF